MDTNGVGCSAISVCMHRITVLCVLLLLYGCASQPIAGTSIYHEPQGFADHAWGASIEDFDNLELAWGDSQDFKGWSHQLASYFNPQETFAYPGTRVRTVEYLFCSHDDRPRLCGVLVSYDSEEYDAGLGVEIREETNHMRILDALTAMHGPAHYSNPRTRVSTRTEDGALILDNLTEWERFSWCNTRDDGRNCHISIIVEYSPFFGRGRVLYAHGFLYAVAAQYQGNMTRSYWLYRLLMNDTAWPRGDMRRMPSKDEIEPFDTAKLVTEQRLNQKAEAEGRVRPKPARALSTADYNYAQFEAYFHYQLRGNPPDVRAYWLGYSLGLSHQQYYGSFDSEEAHDKWLQAQGVPDYYIQFIGVGYRDGLVVTPHPPDPCEQIEGRWDRLRKLICRLRGP